MKAQFVYENLNFERGGDPFKQMDIGHIALEKEKIRSIDWGIVEEFLEKILEKGDYGFEEYMGFYILVYNSSLWFATTNRPKTGFKIGSSSGKAAESKESALKDIKAKIRKRVKDES